MLIGLGHLLIALYTFLLPEPEVKKYSFVVEHNSTIEIEGATNLNTFSCDYSDRIKRDSMRVSGQIFGTKMKLRNANFGLIVESFDCGNFLMNKEFREVLKYKNFPNVEFEIAEIEFRTARDAELKVSEILSKIDINAGGVKRRYKTISHRRIFNKNDAEFSGLLTIDMRDFGIEPPTRAFGTINVQPELKIKYRFFFIH